MLLGCIADDFTGASDVANELAKGGMDTIQFVGIPDSPAPATCEAGVIALKTRSIDPDDAVNQSLAALSWLRDQDCRQFMFKYCSTFDSTPAGNIGPVAEAILAELGAPIAVVCPVFPAAGRRLFMGHLFVNDHLLNESGMEKHPLTPMTDPDIRRWLQRQTQCRVGHIPYPQVRLGESSIRRALASEADAGSRLVVVDAIENDDLKAIGAAVADHALVTGGSGIAIGLAGNFKRHQRRSTAPSHRLGVTGAACVLSGSCSPTSRRQVAEYSQNHPSLKVTGEALLNGTISAAGCAEWIEKNVAESPVVYTTAAPKEVAQSQARYGAVQVASSVEAFFGALAIEVVDGGVRRLVVGGGETSGAVVTALGLRSLAVGPEIDPGVPALFARRHKHRLGLALKSGNFGGGDFFAKALNALEAS